MKKLNIIAFGKELIRTEDLDPIYTMLWRAELDPIKLYRWLLGYFFFYHAGVASKLSDCHSQSFFREALHLAKKSKTPRGTERRHFRGASAIASIKFLWEKFQTPAQAIIELREFASDVNELVKYVSGEWPMFGPWMGFKIADMLERLDISDVKFPIKTLAMYRDPVKGAKLYMSKHQDVEWDGITNAVEHLIDAFSDFKAPPRYERPIGVQEVETILCKWKSHMNGHYPIGKDTHEIREGLKGWGQTARSLRKCLPKIQ